MRLLRLSAEQKAWAWVGGGVAAFILFALIRRGRAGGISAPVLPVAGAGIDPSRKAGFGFKRSATHTHQGVDIGAPTGTPVYAVQGGTVTHAHTELARGFSGYGRAIAIASPPTGNIPAIWHLYAHLDSVGVRAGDRVRAGQLIGTVGRTCFNRDAPEHLCGGAHLHYETSPRPYPQGREASRLRPAQVLAAYASKTAPAVWDRT